MERKMLRLLINDEVESVLKKEITALSKYVCDTNMQLLLQTI